MANFHRRRTICFSEITLIAENNHWRRFVFYLLTKSSTQRTFLFSEEIMNAQALIASMVFTMNVGLHVFVSPDFIINGLHRQASL